MDDSFKCLDLKHDNKSVLILLPFILTLLLLSCQTIAEPSGSVIQEESQTVSRETDNVRAFYIDSVGGDDRNSGTSEKSPWKSVGTMTLRGCQQAILSLNTM